MNTPRTTALPWAALTIALALTLAGCPRADPPPAGGEPPPADRWLQGDAERIEIAGEAFLLELALDEAKRFRGLSDRATIPADAGMLFVFPDAAERAFVMRDCLVPIDIIYLDADGRILTMHEMQVEPYGRAEFLLRRYRSNGRAQFVIELAGGSIHRLGLSEGDNLELPLGELKARAR
ncbi:MAG: DUF192 domain-containing protein [Phycisphaeraceae bacterium]